MAEGSLAERIRRHALDHHVEPARLAQERTVTIRAGDVHRNLSLTGRVPAVCSALASTLFERLAGVTLLGRSGPIQSTTTQFRYRVDPRAENEVGHRVGTATQSPPHPAKPPERAASRVDSAAAVGSGTAGRRLFLVSCVKTKLRRPPGRRTSTFRTGSGRREPTSNAKAARGASCRPSTVLSTRRK